MTFFKTPPLKHQSYFSFQILKCSKLNTKIPQRVFLCCFMYYAAMKDKHCILMHFCRSNCVGDKTVKYLILIVRQKCAKNIKVFKLFLSDYFNTCSCVENNVCGRKLFDRLEM